MDKPSMFPEDLLIDLDHRYGRYLCLYFAAAVSRSTGIPVGIMDAPQAGCLGHAFLILKGNADRNGIVAADATGIRTVAQIRRDFLPTHGRLAWCRDQTVPERMESFEPDSVVMAIARRLPWLAGPLETKAPVEAEFQQVRTLLNAVRDACRLPEGSRWKPVVDLASSMDSDGAEPMPTAPRTP